MKRFLFILIATVFVGSQLKALPYDQARQEAWFLTDKMAYELNLTSDQFDRAYQVNLDYFLSISGANDCYGYYWTYRDNDLRYILFDWQYTLYTTLDYFFRPVRWLRSAWYFPIFDHYRRGYYYFDRPMAYLSYRGEGWRRRGHNDISPFAGYSPRPGGGLRDRYHAGGAPPSRPEVGRGGNRPGFGNDFGNGRDNNRPGFGNNQPGNGNNRPGFGNGSSNGRDNNRGNTNRDNNRDNNRGGSTTTRPDNSGSFGGSNNRGGSTTTRPDRGNTSGNSGSTFGGSDNRGGGTYTRPGRGNTGSGSSSSNFNNRSTSPNRGFSNGRSNTGGRSTTTSRPSRTEIGSSRSTTTRSQSAPSRSSISSARPSRSGRSFGR